jgi:hypothetical protein
LRIVEEARERAAAIQKLSQEFVDTAIPIARTIIRERPLPNMLKTIKAAAIGGQAGGSKFVTNGMFFKVSRTIITFFSLIESFMTCTNN